MPHRQARSFEVYRTRRILRPLCSSPASSSSRSSTRCSTDGISAPAQTTRMAAPQSLGRCHSTCGAIRSKFSARQLRVRQHQIHLAQALSRARRVLKSAFSSSGRRLAGQTLAPMPNQLTQRDALVQRWKRSARLFRVTPSGIWKSAAISKASPVLALIDAFADAGLPLTLEFRPWYRPSCALQVHRGTQAFRSAPGSSTRAGSLPVTPTIVLWRLLSESRPAPYFTIRAELGCGVPPMVQVTAPATVPAGLFDRRRYRIQQRKHPRRRADRGWGVHQAVEDHSRSPISNLRAARLRFLKLLIACSSWTERGL